MIDFLKRLVGLAKVDMAYTFGLLSLSDINVDAWVSLQEGFGNLSLKGTESTILALIILLIVVGLVGTAAVAATSQDQWVTYFHLFDESRLVSPLLAA